MEHPGALWSTLEQPKKKKGDHDMKKKDKARKSMGFATRWIGALKRGNNADASQLFTLASMSPTFAAIGAPETKEKTEAKS